MSASAAASLPSICSIGARPIKPNMLNTLRLHQVKGVFSSRFDIYIIYNVRECRQSLLIYVNCSNQGTKLPI